MRNFYDNPKNSDSSFVEGDNNSIDATLEDTSNEQTSDNDESLLNDNALSCSMCPFTTYNQKILLEHKHRHEKSTLPILTCIYCNLRYSKFNLSTHITKVHPGHKLEGVDEDGLTVLLEETNNKKPRLIQSIFRCPKCKYCAKSKILLNEHLEKHKPEKFIKRKLVKCHKCSYAGTVSNLQRHLRSHEKYPVKKCLYCEYASTLKALIVHQKQCKNHPKSNPLAIKVKRNSQFKCNFCSLSTTNSLNFKKHLILHEKYLKNVKCGLCSFEAPKPTMKWHFLVSHKSAEKEKNSLEKEKLKKYSLTHGNNNFKLNANNVEEHVQHEHNENYKLKYSFKCKNCSFSTIKLAYLRAHRRTHLQKQPLNECTECNYKSTPKALEIHMLDCHTELDIENKTGQCFVCSASFKQNRNFLQHWKTHIEGFPMVKCLLCDYEATPAMVFRHKKKCHKKILKNSNISDANEDKLSGLKINKNNFSNQKENSASKYNKYSKFLDISKHLIQCHLCDAKIIRWCIKAHIQSHSSEPLKECPKCNLKSTPKYIRAHRKETGHCWTINRSIKKGGYKCELCSLILTTSAGLKVHINSHLNGNENKKCSKCNFASTPAGLVKHIRTTGHYFRTEKSFKEELENDSSGDQNSAKVTTKKLQTHFFCDLCPFSTLLRIKLNMHKKKDHDNGTLLNCSICPWTTQNDESLKEHLKTHYVGNNTPVLQCVIPKYDNEKVLLYCSKSSCSFTTYFPADLKNHQHIRALIKCEFCSFSSYWQYLIDRHLVSHKKFNMPIEYCSNCDFHSTPVALSAHKNKCLKRQK